MLHLGTIPEAGQKVYPDVDELLAQLQSENMLERKVPSNGDDCYRPTPLGDKVAEVQLTADTIVYLNRTLEIPELSWVDLMIVAATSPHLAPQIISYSPEARDFARDMYCRESSLLRCSPQVLMTQLGSSPEWVLRGLFITHVGCYLLSGMGQHQVAERFRLDVDEVESIRLSLCYHLYAMTTLASSRRPSALALHSRLCRLVRRLCRVSPDTAISSCKFPAFGKVSFPAHRVSKSESPTIPLYPAQTIDDIENVIRALHGTSL